jgi:hypothetical protein
VFSVRYTLTVFGNYTTAREERQDVAGKHSEPREPRLACQRWLPWHAAGERGAKCEGKPRSQHDSRKDCAEDGWDKGICPRPSPAMVISARGANPIHAATLSAATATPRGNSGARRIGGRAAILRMIVWRAAYNVARAATSPSAATTMATGPRRLTRSAASVSQGRQYSHADACSARRAAIERIADAEIRVRSPRAMVPRQRVKTLSPSHQQREPLGRGPAEPKRRWRGQTRTAPRSAPTNGKGVACGRRYRRPGDILP